MNRKQAKKELDTLHLLAGHLTRAIRSIDHVFAVGCDLDFDNTEARKLWENALCPHGDGNNFSRGAIFFADLIEMKKAVIKRIEELETSPTPKQPSCTVCDIDLPFDQTTGAQQLPACCTSKHPDLCKDCAHPENKDDDGYKECAKCGTLTQSTFTFIAGNGKETIWCMSCENAFQKNRPPMPPIPLPPPPPPVLPPHDSDKWDTVEVEESIIFDDDDDNSPVY